MKLEIRSKDEMIASGYVNAVGRDSRVLPSPRGRFIEQIEPNTFNRALLKADDTELRFNHDKTIGSTRQGNLTLKEDSIGLYAQAIVRDPEVIAKADELRGWSFGMHVIEDEWEETADGIPRRHVKEIELKEVSLLTKLPAYIGTSIETRDEEQLIYEQRSIDDKPEVLISSGLIHKHREIEILKIRSRLNVKKAD